MKDIKILNSLLATWHIEHPDCPILINRPLHNNEAPFHTAQPRIGLVGWIENGQCQSLNLQTLIPCRRDNDVWWKDKDGNIYDPYDFDNRSNNDNDLRVLAWTRAIGGSIFHWVYADWAPNGKPEFHKPGQIYVAAVRNQFNIGPDSYTLHFVKPVEDEYKMWIDPITLQFIEHHDYAYDRDTRCPEDEWPSLPVVDFYTVWPFQELNFL